MENQKQNKENTENNESTQKANLDNKSDNKDVNDIKVDAEKVEAKKEQPKAKPEVAKDPNQKFYGKLELSIRWRDTIAGLPGDDVTEWNRRLGSAYKGRAPLSGLSHDEEEKYLPEIINVSPKDVNWRKEVKEYWSNISEKIPHDDVGTEDKYPGRKIKFTVAFDKESDKNSFDKAKGFEAKAEISKRGNVLMEDVADYVLFRYALVNRRVANDAKDRYKSALIEFYLYSPQVETRKKYTEFQLKNQARELFTTLLQEPDKIDAILRLFGHDPDDEFEFSTVEDKHLKLDEEISSNAKNFLQYANDKGLREKALIKQAVDAGIIYNPSNTETYYYGNDKEVLIGRSTQDAVLFLKSKEPKSVQILESIKSQLMFQKA